MSNDLMWDRFWSKLPKRVNDRLLALGACKREHLIVLTRKDLLSRPNFGAQSLATLAQLASEFSIELHHSVAPRRVETRDGVAMSLPAIDALTRAKAAIDDATVEVRKAVQTALVTGQADLFPLSVMEARLLVLLLSGDSLHVREVAATWGVSAARVYELRSRLRKRLDAWVSSRTGDKEFGGP